MVNYKVGKSGKIKTLSNNDDNKIIIVSKRKVIIWKV
jgi:hypothetical protein